MKTTDTENTADDVLAGQGVSDNTRLRVLVNKAKGNSRRNPSKPAP